MYAKKKKTILTPYNEKNHKISIKGEVGRWTDLLQRGDGTWHSAHIVLTF